MRPGAVLALGMSLLLHAALFAAVASFTLGRASRPAGDHDESVPGVTFGFVVDAPLKPEPPAEAPEPPPMPPSEPPPPVPVPEPAAPLPVEPVTSVTSAAPSSMPAPPEATPRRISSLPPKPQRPSTSGASARGARSGDASFIPAVCTHRAMPDFPATARRERRQGAAVVLISVDAAGRITAARVETSSGHSALDAAALNAARRCRFRPALRGIVPVASEVRVPYTFRLDR